MHYSVPNPVTYLVVYYPQSLRSEHIHVNLYRSLAVAKYLQGQGPANKVVRISFCPKKGEIN
jgi:hypothetical protein